jgi:hypothetical protein
MTYIFKLARRLAVSRAYLLPALIVVAACASDAMAPNPESMPVEVSIQPSSVTLETNQLLQFRARGRNQAGEDIAAPISWSTTGGTILPDGRFSAPVVGTYQVIGRTRTRDNLTIEDTSTVRVVRRQLALYSVEVAPVSVNLTPGTSQAFTALGRLRTGNPVPFGVIWTATGGIIDEGGAYVAGDTAGTYRVIATNTTGTVADTAIVTVEAPPVPAPPPAPPVLASVTVVPATITLAPGASLQFAAFGRMTTGDSVAVGVVYTATGGSVSPDGRYTAGGAGGTFRLVATSGELADTSIITITPPSAEERGIPFGPFELFRTSVDPNPVGPFTVAVGTSNPSTLVGQLDTARKLKVRLILQMTGGSHSRYLTNGKFDISKWKAKQAEFDKPAIRDAVAKAVADGTIIVAELQDEPEHSTWGGVMTAALIDEMSRYTKSLFPTLKTSILTQLKWVKAQGAFQSLDVMAPQYSRRLGTVTAYRDSALALAGRTGLGLMFSMNILNGGEQLGPDCPLDRTGGPGTWYYGYGDTYRGNCAMSASQIEQWGKTLGLTPEACALIMWRWDEAFMADSENAIAFANVASALANRGKRACGR